MNEVHQNLLHIEIKMIDETIYDMAEPDRLLLVYCIAGRIVVNEQKTYLSGEFTILERGEEYVLQGDSQNIGVLINMDYYALCCHKNRDSLFFFCDSMQESGVKYRELQTSLEAVLKALALHGKDSLTFMSECLLMQKVLLDNFVIDNGEGDMPGMTRYMRVQRILDYIYLRSTEKISLKNLSDKLYVSPSTLSRTFMEMTGESFVSYVKKVRLLKVRNELIKTDKAITNIAIDNGFSNASAMSSAFRETFDMLPSEFRKLYRNNEEEKKEQKILSNRLKQFYDVPDVQNEPASKSQMHISFSEEHFQKKWENKILNVGAAKFLNNARVQRDILYLQKNLGIEYIRIWNICSEDVIIWNRELRKFSFVWLDSLLDFCVANHIKLFIDLGQRAEVIWDDESKPLYKKFDSLEFESPEEWEHFLTMMIRHMLKKYGSAVVSEWIFEFGFFLNEKPYYITPAYKSTQVWDRGVDIIRREIPGAKVAGPGMYVLNDREFLNQIIGSYMKCRHQPDILTCISFPYNNPNGEDALTSFHEPFRKLSNNPVEFQKNLQILREVLQENNFQGELVLTEWNFSMSNRNYLQDSEFRSSVTAEMIMRGYDLCDSMALWIATDQIGIAYDTEKVLNGSAGILSVDGLRKPVYFVYTFLRQMGKYRLLKRDNILVTADSRNEYYILLWNNKRLSARYYITEGENYGPKDLDSLFSDEEPFEAEILINGLKDNDRFKIKNQILNKEKGNVLKYWNAMDCYNELSFEEIEYLKQISVPEITLEEQIIHRGCLRLSLELQPNEVRLVTISRVIG
ncbi:MAG: helix-turn-helix domain-containing protein [Eubacteriales bacterium]|nr:helix-turn-helix domain-containing protein [Eubacteriales bacterium]